MQPIGKPENQLSPVVTGVSTQNETTEGYEIQATVTIPQGYTRQQIIDVLHGPAKTFGFRYDLLDKTNKLKGRLDKVLAASVSNNIFAEIKRIARFTVEDDGTIDYLNDRSRPWVRLKMPDGGWVEWPQGVFLLSTPRRQATGTGSVVREIEAYDQLQVLADDKIETRYTVTAGTNYIEAVRELLASAGITNVNLTPSAATLPADRDWAPGTAKKAIINDLLTAINYRSLWFDELGTAVAEPYISPAERASEYVLATDNASIIQPGATDGLDLFSVPNRWVLYVSEPDREPLTAVYTNENPNSPTSTVSRGRIITDFREVDAADQATLDARAERLAFESSQAYNHVDLPTGLIPFLSDSDVVTLKHTTLGIEAKYLMTGWEMDLKAGASCLIRLRRVITI